MNFFKLFSDIFNVFSKARIIREDEEARKKSVRFGLSSIIYSLLAVAFAFAGAFMFTVSDNLLYIFIIIIAITLLVGAVVALIGALMRVIAQFTLNAKAVSWIALVVFIASIAASVIIIIHFAG